jgi:hypothetical protein
MSTANIGKIEKVTDEKEEAIDSLRITMSNSYKDFNEAVLRMDGALSQEGNDYSGAMYYEESMKYLDRIEDSIKRFKENRIQAFEE